LSEAAYLEVARDCLRWAQPLGLRVLLDRSPEQVPMLGADGWHASSRQLATLTTRPAVPLAVASAHTAGELNQARALGFEAAVLGPVRATASHPGQPGLGWVEFSARRGSSALSVYAIGGMGTEELLAARRANAQGIAGISAYWRA
jgi:8-oxo-dGTP diphosphatase